MSVVIKNEAVFPGGHFSNEGWVLFWAALWSAPTQPGFVQLVRQGLQAMIDFDSEMIDEAEQIDQPSWDSVLGAALVGILPGILTSGIETKDDVIGSLKAARGQLQSLYLPLAASDDPVVVNTTVVRPLLTRGELPLNQIGIHAKVVTRAAPLRPWVQIFNDEVAQPVAKTAGAVVSAVSRGVPWVLIGIGVGVVWYLSKTGKNAGLGSEQ